VKLEATGINALSQTPDLSGCSASVSAICIADFGAVYAVVAAMGGLVVVFDILLNQIVATHNRHKGAEVTCIAVDVASGHIISGDSEGVVVVADSGLSKIAGTHPTAGVGSAPHSKPVFDMPTAVPDGLDPLSRVVQLQMAPATSKDLLCTVSTLTRTCMLRIPATARGTTLAKDGGLVLVTVGKKPRDGDFGATFDLSSNAQAVSTQRLAFAARPAKRMWIVDVETATVLSTVKYVMCASAGVTGI
jgi:hypothetical protein